MSVLKILYHPVSGKTNNLLLFSVALIPALVLFQFPVSVFSNGIDPPLAWVFNFLVKGNLPLGKSIIFPHGPLAFLMYPLPMGSNLWIAVSIHLAARIFLAYSLLKLATKKPVSILVLAFASTFVLLALNDLLLTLVQIIILCYLNFFERRNITWLIPALIFTPLALYIKAFVGIVSFLVTLSFAGIMIYRAIVGLESWYRLLLFLIVPFVLIMVWLGMYHDLDGIAGYLSGMMELAADNSAAAAVYPDNNWWFIGLALVSGLTLFLLNLRNIALFRYLVLVLPALFAIWKYGMAREDYLHTSMLFIFILFILLVYNILTSKFWLLNIGFSIVVVVFFYLTLQKSYYYEPFKIKANGLQSLIGNSVNNKFFVDTCSQSTQKMIARNKLDPAILAVIGDQTVDIYPWDYSYMAANKLNWKPRPVLQSYASYTRYLDQLNASHFASEEAPEFLLWELRKVTRDIHGGSLESIDGRCLLNDEPETLLTLLSHYELVAAQKGIFPVLVYRKRAHPLNPENKIIGQAKAGWNIWINVPENTTDILRASVTMKRGMAGELKSFLYKDEAFYVYYLLAQGDIRMYRIVPKNAEYGLWINPLIMNPENGQKENSVKKVMFRCSNTEMMSDEIDIKWSQVTFSVADTLKKINTPNVNPVPGFFNISNDNIVSEILLSTNALYKKVPFWSEPDESNISSQGRNRSLRLKPDSYSVSFEYPLDSLSYSVKDENLVIRTSMWAKASSGAKAIYVISIEKDGKSLLWKAVDIQGFIHEHNTMNFVTNFVAPEADLISQKGLMLKVYAWNNGGEYIELDDFSVRIEKIQEQLYNY